MGILVVWLPGVSCCEVYLGDVGGSLDQGHCLWFERCELACTWGAGAVENFLPPARLLSHLAEGLLKIANHLPQVSMLSVI